MSLKDNNILQLTLFLDRSVSDDILNKLRKINNFRGYSIIFPNAQEKSYNIGKSPAHANFI